ncbi:hypothetical protein WJX79_006980 [Trebouxia sp. C0005]
MQTGRRSALSGLRAWSDECTVTAQLFQSPGRILALNTVQAAGGSKTLKDLLPIPSDQDCKMLETATVISHQGRNISDE